MRKLYNEFFYIPKHGKIREKVMLTRLISTITIVIVCLAAMSITAYAYFSYNITSSFNTIKAAHFEADVVITITDSNNEPVTVTKSGKAKTANLEAGKYTIELSKGDCTAQTGFCILTIDDKSYFTDQIGVDTDKALTDANVKFELWLSSPTKIEVLSHWGTSVYYGYKDAGRTEIFIVNGDTLDLTAGTTNGDTDESEETVTPAETQNNPSTTETNTPSNPETTITTELESTETTTSADQSEPVNTTEPQATTETQSAEETAGTTTTEASE